MFPVLVFIAMNVPQMIHQRAKLDNEALFPMNETNLHKNFNFLAPHIIHMYIKQTVSLVVSGQVVVSPMSHIWQQDFATFFVILLQVTYLSL